MPYSIENLTIRPVWLTLTSGQTLRLAPQETSGTLADIEIANNPKLQKLKDKHIIAISEAKLRPQASSVSQSKKSEEDHASFSSKKKETKPRG